MYVRLFIRAYVVLREVGSVNGLKRRCSGEEKHGAEGGKDTRDCLLVRFGRDVIHSDVTSVLPLNRSTDTRTVPRPCSSLATGSCEVFHCQHLQQPLNATLVTLYSRYFYIPLFFSRSVLINGGFS